VKACNVCISSSIKGESFQKSVAEAMHLGVCPVITDVPGNQGMVIDKKSGLIVPMKNAEAIKDAFVYLYSNPELCPLYGENAQEYITRHFPIEETVKKVMAMYDDLLAT
jgi:glycosyltransferase involved in cell wall biosynthesis